MNPAETLLSEVHKRGGFRGGIKERASPNTADCPNLTGLFR
jgi:hypothetical protein